jgi:phosphonate transport system permease protein
MVIGCTGYTLNATSETLRPEKVLRNFTSMIAEMLPPEWRVIPSLGKSMWDSVAMSVMATVLAALFAFPFSFLAARNTSPHALIALGVKSTFSFLRTIPELVLAIIFVASVGFGILPGILAMGLHSIGSLGKLYSEAIEKAEPGLMEAVASCGGSQLHIIVFGVIPQIVAQAADFTLYRWEMNFRASTVVGMVGAGGIGFELLSTLRLMQYRQVAAILLAIFVVVQLVDSFGNLVRTRLLGPITT